MPIERPWRRSHRQRVARVPVQVRRQRRRQRPSGHGVHHRERQGRRGRHAVRLQRRRRCRRRAIRPHEADGRREPREEQALHVLAGAVGVPGIAPGRATPRSSPMASSARRPRAACRTGGASAGARARTSIFRSIWAASERPARSARTCSAIRSGMRSRGRSRIGSKSSRRSTASTSPARDCSRRRCGGRTSRSITCCSTTRRRRRGTSKLARIPRYVRTASRRSGTCAYELQVLDTSRYHSTGSRYPILCRLERRSGRSDSEPRGSDHRDGLRCRHDPASQPPRLCQPGPAGGACAADRHPRFRRPPVGPIDEIVLHAAVDGQVLGGWTVTADTTAASGARLQNPNANAAKLATRARRAGPGVRARVQRRGRQGVPALAARQGARTTTTTTTRCSCSSTAASTPPATATWRIGHDRRDDRRARGLQRMRPAGLGLGRQRLRRERARPAGLLRAPADRSACASRCARTGWRSIRSCCQPQLSDGAARAPQERRHRLRRAGFRAARSERNADGRITSPATGAAYTAPATITVEATASDPDGTIAKVEFYNNGMLVGRTRRRRSPPRSASTRPARSR